MTDKKMDELLKSALSSMEKPEESLNREIRKRAKEIEMNKKRRYRKLLTAAAAAVVLLGVSTTALAAYRLLSASAAAKKLQPELEKPFVADNILENEVSTQEEEYTVTLLGLLLGEKLPEGLNEEPGISDGHTYAAVAIARTDGAPMQETDGTAFMVSPLIEGLNPAEYNITTTKGSYSWEIMDGVLYYIVDCYDISCFADRKIYLAVLDNTFYDNQAYSYDETTGAIGRKESYDGMNLLFDLPVDSSLADGEKAKRYLEQLHREWEEDVEIPELPEAEDIVKKAALLEDSVKEMVKNGNGEYVYEYGDGMMYTSDMIFGENEYGYLLGFVSEGDEAKHYLIFHRDEAGKITGMVYEEKN